MSRRVFACCAAIVLFPLLGLSPAQAQACSGTECSEAAPAKPTKPLDILKFMREQAASTRTADPQPRKAQAVAHAPRRTHQVIAAQRQAPAQPTPPMPAQAASSFVPQQDPAVQVVAGDEFNAIDAAGNPAPAVAPAETVGAAASAEPGVPMAVAEEFNDIDRKAAESAAAEQAHVEQASVSWLHRIWSALTNTFTALAMAVHNLIG